MRKRFLLDCGLVGVLGVAVLGSTLALSGRSDNAEFFDPMIDIKHLLDTRFVREFDEKDVQTAAIRGMLDAIGDPYTVYVPGEVRGEFQKELTGEYVGIGAQITLRDGWLTVVTPLEDSPAYRTGIMADDRIVEINGESTAGWSSDDSVQKLTGEPGTPVDIVVERDGRRIPMKVTRDHIKTRSVKGLTRLGEDLLDWRYLIDADRSIGYLRLTQFTPDCSQEVAHALTAMGADSGALRGLIIDLRWNPGGVLEEAARIADFFLRDGVIVSTRGRAFPERVIRATAADTLPEFPIAILINDSSASASEILAGALTENGRAIAVGTRSFGKGSVQSVINLPSSDDGAQLKITEQLYYLPSGRCLHRLDDSVEWGVDPTPGYYVPISPEEEFDLFNARHARELIRAADHDQALDRWSDPTWIASEGKDAQMSAALAALQDRADHGAWPSVDAEAPPASRITAEELRQAQLIRQRLEREMDRIDRRIESLATVASKEETAVDLWPDDADIVGGELTVRDAHGHEIAHLRINGAQLERWLVDAGVEPIGSPPPTEQ
ncbi:MAG: S41 family peptidase [Phycisphaeraceae bacterium]|nr:S41 family peptidase [Phycisphaeraceae bacterium]